MLNFQDVLLQSQADKYLKRYYTEDVKKLHENIFCHLIDQK